MATTLDSRPTARTFDVEQLVAMAWAGNIRVPHFQRDFRWSWRDVVRLFDSIVRGYPIGSLLLWAREAPKQRLRLGGLIVDAPKSEKALWVVDGQQRITSLASALHSDGLKDPRFALAYDLRAQKFVAPPRSEDPLVIPLPVLFDLQGVLTWFAEHPEVNEHLHSATGVTRTLRQYEVPAYEYDDVGVLQDVFDRMNNYGKRLSRAEVFSALNAGDDAAADGLVSFDEIAQQVDADFSFGLLDSNTVLQAVLARRDPDVKRDIRNEFDADDDEGRDKAYEAGAAAIRRAVEFLQSDAGVPHVAMLAYRYLIVVLARVFAHHPDPDVRNRRLLRRWYWRAALLGPLVFRGGTPDAARAFCAKVRPEDLTGSVQSLLEAVRRKPAGVPDLGRFATNQAATKILLCAWWAASPRSPETGEVYTTADLADCLGEQMTARDAVRDLVPRRLVPDAYRPSAANRILMPVLQIDSQEVVDLITGPHLNVPDKEWDSTLRSHWLTTEMTSLLAHEHLPQFFDVRLKVLRSGLEAFLSAMCEWNYEDTPPLSELLLDEDDDGVE